MDLRFKDQRIRRKSPVDTKAGAESYERQIRRELLEGTFEKRPEPPKREVPTFGTQPLDHIGVGAVAAFRASLVERGLSEKRINNVLAVLSKALNDAVDVELISRAPKVGLFRVERPAGFWPCSAGVGT